MSATDLSLHRHESRESLRAPPFLVIALSWTILGEAVRWYHLVGASMVIAGVVLAARR
jgi:drug/metabolite transporter (DMT)-like permease